MPMRRFLPVVAVLVVVGVFLLIRRDGSTPEPPAQPPASALPAHDDDVMPPLPGERLMGNTRDPFAEPIEDLRALDRVIVGYFSIIKDHEGYSIGGNEDLAAALRGENAYKQRFLPDDHYAFGADGRLIDRWETPIFVHPIAARDIELRSAGPDREMFTNDDIVLNKSSVDP
ncbi:hypothetical protein [Haloferula sp. A504]|uniref:hypothetical protein n=1 Tax=Haloferula sp. A504 TaxID=3373601 RepID=UPI0031C2E650|nr:hypothetical protein [Verrucomicrobiaceae bacterium E54]